MSDSGAPPDADLQQTIDAFQLPPLPGNVTVIRDGSFEGGSVEVDGKAFVKCKFVNIQVKYYGGLFPHFIGCSFIGCSLGLDGQASNTIGYLRSIYHGFDDWGKGSVESLFDEIRKPFPTAPRRK